MTGRSAFRLGQGIGALVAIGIVIIYAMWGDLLRLTSDAAQRNVVLWLYDRDAAPGQTIQGRAWLDSEHAHIAGVNVYLDGKRIAQDDCPADCKDRTVDFSFTLPEGDPEIRYVYDFEIVTRDPQLPDDQVTFSRWVRTYSKGMSALRRTGKGVLAIGCMVVVAALVFGLKRFALRRGREPSGLWLVPVVAAGAFTFVPLVGPAARLHGWVFVGLALAAWSMGVFAIAERFNRRIGLTAFAAASVLIETGPEGGYRGAQVTTPIKPIEDVENAWVAVGLVVRRAGSDMIVTAPEGRFAVVPVPASASFGGAPLVFRANDSELAELLVAAAASVLGEYRLM